MKPDTPKVTKLSDYKPYDFDVRQVELDFDLKPDATIVRSRLHITRTGISDSLFLNGEDIELLALKLDGKTVPKSQIKLSADGLTISGLPHDFILDITTKCQPVKNTQLMGLYVSGGRFCTQCEAQGFRRITFFPDRPDVLARYKVRLSADKASYPILLANGNKIDAGDLPGGRHFALWEDPFPKPCYLFALVAGKFDIVSDSFTTMSGRNIRLDIFVDPGDAGRAGYAMDALKRSMKWDEDAFGREYDLDRFMIVAVRDFNFGAMENKGLNIFNSALLLADEATATDMNFERIESVVAHEYFHNWSGNRITCRDWFQLCLKEGFTVFRDQEFSAAQRGEALQRIKDVKALRARQFTEDSGPLAHPVRPASYMKIDNFYTATIYEKGAELIRMLKMILGAAEFRKACDLYFDTLDGTAATVEQFLHCFEQASGRDLSQFMRWYEQAGTPKVTVKTNFDTNAQTFDITFNQYTKPTPGHAANLPLMIPVKMALLDEGGKNYDEKSIVLTDKTTRIRYKNIREKPALSVFQNFSAPVHINLERPLDDALLLMRCDNDLFNRWEAGQALARDILCDLTLAIFTGKPEQNLQAFFGYVRAIGDVICDENLDPGFKSLAMGLPSDSDVLQALSPGNRLKNDPGTELGTDPLAILNAKKMLRRAVADHHKNSLLKLYRTLSDERTYMPDAYGGGRRALRNMCLSFLVDIPDQQALNTAKKQYENATNMTDEFAALLLLIRCGEKHASTALQQFYTKWQDNPLVIDKWFSACALQSLDKVKAMLSHPDYNPTNPNRVRALIGGFAAANPQEFHRMDGEGYGFYADNIIVLDKSNPQLAANLLGAFGNLSVLDTPRLNMIKAELNRVLDSAPSANVLEIARKSLENF
ncbi:MAG: aminopeptidase N [Robiginitomaculum sp.]|nr:MAG: aminopeptidase N [Robiginitomaculum sp.]